MKGKVSWSFYCFIIGDKGVRISYCWHFIVRITYDLPSIIIIVVVLCFNGIRNISSHLLLKLLRKCCIREWIFTFSFSTIIWIILNRIIWLLLSCWQFINKQINTMKVKILSNLLTNKSVFIFSSLMLSIEHENLVCRVHYDNFPGLLKQSSPRVDTFFDWW